MEHTMPFFLTITQRIFSNWTALKLAVEHDMGPIESAREFCSYITDVLYMNEGLVSSQIADELDDYMDNQFNTELQDDSSMQIAEELLRFHRYCMEGNESTLKVEFEKLPPLQSWLNLEPTQPRQTDPQPAKHKPNNLDEDMDIDKNEPEEDGWTMVTSRRSK
ncbi:pre-rRNA-processing protein TSR2 homolog [Monomorium pharaonis]|uniref:pre-rRNA-processing protein TSR2 homolog n=1 Tax=Monomorium pharaonis TaxID=307658 RepID=UPI00063F7623|nr:pre-rRNA-processing protein TSR2 homolog [Monomorium pharaonis]